MKRMERLTEKIILTILLMKKPNLLPKNDGQQNKNNKNAISKKFNLTDEQKKAYQQLKHEADNKEFELLKRRYLSPDYRIRGESLIENEKELINEANGKPALIQTIKLIKAWRKFFA